MSVMYNQKDIYREKRKVNSLITCAIILMGIAPVGINTYKYATQTQLFRWVVRYKEH
jgi:hypothetical protein